MKIEMKGKKMVKLIKNNIHKCIAIIDKNSYIFEYVLLIHNKIFKMLCLISIFHKTNLYLTYVLQPPQNILCKCNIFRTVIITTVFSMFYRRNTLIHEHKSVICGKRFIRCLICSNLYNM